VECETLVDAGVALLRAPSLALKNFRVIGVISNVLLVVDTATEGSFIVKVPNSIACWYTCRLQPLFIAMYCLMINCC